MTCGSAISRHTALGALAVSAVIEDGQPACPARPILRGRGTFSNTTAVIAHPAQRFASCRHAGEGEGRSVLLTSCALLGAQISSHPDRIAPRPSGTCNGRGTSRESLPSEHDPVAKTDVFSSFTAGRAPKLFSAGNCTHYPPQKLLNIKMLGRQYDEKGPRWLVQKST